MLREVTFLSRVLQFANNGDKTACYKVVHGCAKNGAADYRGYAFLGREHGFSLIGVIWRGREYRHLFATWRMGEQELAKI